MQADLGGTELLRPLQWIEEHSAGEGRVRQMFLLTDGEISNVTEVLNLCRSMATSTRIFSFGLGKSPSRSLVKGLACATNGKFVFIPPHSNVDVYVGEQLQKALQSCITNVHVKWNLGVPVLTAPNQSPSVYVNDRLIFYALINDKTIPFDHNSSVELQTEPDRHSLGIAKVDHIPNVGNEGMLARLTAKALILELQHAKLLSPNTKKIATGSTQAQFQKYQETATTNEEKMETSSEETTKQQIIALSLKYNILSPHTAFVGIEKRTNASNVDMILREMPIQVSVDDQHLQGLSITGSGSRLCIGGAMIRRNARRRVSNTSAKESMSCIRPQFGIGCHTLSSSISTNDKLDLDNDEEAYFEYRLSKLKTDYEEKKSSDKELWPLNDQDIVRYLINEQKFDGIWDLDSQAIKNLTGKTLADFQVNNNQIDHQVLISAIIIAVFETRFTAFTTMWYGIVQKARKRLIDLLGADSRKLDQLIENILKLF